MAPTLVRVGVAAAAVVPMAAFAQVTPTPTDVSYPDEPWQACAGALGDSCPSTPGVSVPEVPDMRGICVANPAAAGRAECWDACLKTHAPMDYYTVAVPTPELESVKQQAIALMVKQIRTGMRVASCGDAFASPTCNPGERCTPANVAGGERTLNRGMCVTCTSASQIGCPVGAGNECLDMCDTSIPISTFKNTAGKQAGTLNIVEKVRAGQDPQGFTTCPGASVWLWLWIPIALCCSLGFCGLAYWMFNYYRGTLKRGVKGKKPDSFRQDDGPYGNYDQAPAPYQDMGVIEQQPMPVNEPMLDQTVPPMEEVPALAPVLMEAPNLFGDPNLLAPVQAMPATTYMQPATYSYPQASSMAISNPLMGSTMGYAPYGAYTTGPTTTSYAAAAPQMFTGSASMRMG